MRIVCHDFITINQPESGGQKLMNVTLTGPQHQRRNGAQPLCFDSVANLIGNRQTVPGAGAATLMCVSLGPHEQPNLSVPTFPTPATKVAAQSGVPGVSGRLRVV
uniref:Uncharacterized protein n=1 Tax=Anopheles merus TaxID=30066 RepID=A0A182UYF2_ANOME